MKFHNLFVFILNPLKILLLGFLTAICMILLFNADMIPADKLHFMEIPYLQGEILLMVLSGVLLFSFLFALIAEILLAKRRVLGVTLLILGFLMEVASSVINVIHGVSFSSVAVLAVTAFIALMVCVYYWKRGKLLH